jgi:hypothetical protein
LTGFGTKDKLKRLLLIFLLQGCTQTGVQFQNCSQPELGELAIDISLENMMNIAEVVDRMNISCKKEITYPSSSACYFVRLGDKNIGNRGLIVVTDEYIGECIIHEFYHIELAIKYGNPDQDHNKYWDYVWLEELLNEYKEIKNEVN